MRGGARVLQKRTPETERLRAVRVAVCGEMPTACEALRRMGVVHVDTYADAVNLCRASSYHLILVYAPQGEGLFHTFCRDGAQVVPLRLLNEPCCHSALIELCMTVESVARTLAESVAQ